jgi:alkanesulfonate monooxygenase SsuD/methylene tetrahydromethanopterin reductase-like flavin-dependent oxidoreductase (luciferase family)
MRYGFVLPYGDARTAAQLAVLAEEHGWDGFFVWEPVWGIDAWVSLTAAAMRTDRIRLGTMLTPLPRRKPWDVASQSATLDNLSGGRVILSVGLGAPDDRWWLFEEDPGRRTRAELLDEGLELLTGLWRGAPLAYDGKHFRARPADRLLPAPPVQRPRIPIWVVGAWPHRKSMRRAARYDGWLPAFVPKSGQHDELTPGVVREGCSWIATTRQAAGLDGAYDIVVEGTSGGSDARDTVRPWAEAGATWWLEANWEVAAQDVVEVCGARLRRGPPHVE